MTVRQFPQPGDVIARRVQEQGGAGNFHGAVLVARRDEPLQSEATDLSNVIPFSRPRRAGAAPQFPLPSIAAHERPAPHTVKFGIARGLALIVGSLLLHSSLVAMFWHQPKPMTSIGVEAMSVEITIGPTAAAGFAPTAGEPVAQSVTPPEEPKPEEPVSEPQSRAATVMLQEVPLAAQDTAPEVAPESAEDKPVEPQPPEQPPETAVAETTSAIQPTQRTERPRPQVQAVQKAPERKRVDAAKDKKASQKKQVAAVTSGAVSGGGAGRSDNYNGVVFAHLARHKQYPTALRASGAQGVARVSFSIDGGGRVTAARLAGSSGNAGIDQEAVATARRASPFPPPPDGKGRTFTVAVGFKLQ